MRISVMFLGLTLASGSALAAESPAKQLNALLGKINSMQAVFT